MHGGFGLVVAAMVVRVGRGLRERQVVEWSDPRLPAIKNTVFNYIQYPHPTRVTAVFEGSHLLEDDDGSWAGTSTGVSYPDGSIDGQDILVGRGAYEGLYAVLHARRDRPGRWRRHGVARDDLRR